MKFSLFIVSALGAASVASAQFYVPGDNGTQTYLIGGAGFEQLVTEGTTYDFNQEVTTGFVAGLYSDTTERGDYSKTIQAAQLYTPRLSVFWDGTNDSSVWDGSNFGFDAAGNIGGYGFLSTAPSTVGDGLATTRRVTAGSHLLGKNIDSEDSALGANDNFTSASLGLRTLTGNVLTMTLNTAGYDLGEIRFAGLSVGTASINWEYKIGSGSYVSLGSQALTGAFSEYSSSSFAPTLGALFTGGEQLTFRLSFTAADNTEIALDSFQFIGSSANVIPEPSTYAAVLGLATVGIALLRRRKQHAIA